MNQRNEFMKKIVSDTREELVNNFSSPDNSEYRETLKNLIIQGMIKLLEPEVLINCREADRSLVESLLNECESEYAKFMLQESRKEYTTKLIIQDQSLESLGMKTSGGGVWLKSKDGKISCTNTLEDRLNLCYEELLPEIRQLLFPRVK